MARNEAGEMGVLGSCQGIREHRGALVLQSPARPPAKGNGVFVPASLEGIHPETRDQTSAGTLGSEP